MRIYGPVWNYALKFKKKYSNIRSLVVTERKATISFVCRGNSFHCDIMEWEFFISRLGAATVSSGEHNLSRIQQRISGISSLYKTGSVQRKRRNWQGGTMEGSFIPGCTFTTSKVNCHKADETESCVYASPRAQLFTQTHFSIFGRFEK